jgi:enediyne biosynthesis protein E3
MTALGSVRRRLFGIPAPRKVFSKPGFEPEAWQRFAPVAESLALGYNATLEDSTASVLHVRLQGVDPVFSGFAYEGAGMGLGALDLMNPRKKRLDAFVAGPGSAHIYTVYVGLGLALARLRRQPERHLGELDPLLGWAIVDGYGFHGGFFERRRYITKKARPNHLSPNSRPLFDQGLGRAIWFSSGAVIDRAAETVASLQPDRHGDLWNGVGMACAYGGGTDRAGLDRICQIAEEHRDRLAWGAATAAWTRELAGNHAAHTDLACEVFSGISSDDAARVLAQGRHEIDGSTLPTPISAWRSHFTTTAAIV